VPFGSRLLAFIERRRQSSFLIPLLVVTGLVSGHDINRGDGLIVIAMLSAFMLGREAGCRH
jgi:hypothetical protein